MKLWCVSAAVDIDGVCGHISTKYYPYHFITFPPWKMNCLYPPPKEAQIKILISFECSSALSDIWHRDPSGPDFVCVCVYFTEGMAIRVKLVERPSYITTTRIWANPLVPVVTDLFQARGSLTIPTFLTCNQDCGHFQTLFSVLFGRRRYHLGPFCVPIVLFATRTGWFPVSVLYSLEKHY